MGTRIFCFVIVVVFLASVIGYAVWAIYQQVNTGENPDPKTTAELAEERLEQLNLGNLADFEALSTDLTSNEVQDLIVGQGDLYVVGNDVVTYQAQYALAESGQILYDTTQNPEATTGGDTVTQAINSFCGNWPAAFSGMKIAGKRRLWIPAAEIGRCLDLSQEPWLAGYDLVIDVELVGIADRPVIALESLENLGTLDDFTPLSDRVDELSFEDVSSGSGLAVEAADIVVVEARYALAQSGQIFAATTTDEAGNSFAETLRIEDFCFFWRESLIGIKTGVVRHLLLPANNVVACSPPLNGWVADHDLVIEVKVLEIIDRSFADLAPRMQAASELVIEDVVIGQGAEVVKPGATVSADYIGMLALDGSVFDSGQAVSFGLDNVIAGWQEGLVGMKVGGVRHLIIPASQGYGPGGSGGGIPPNADLIFRVQLVEIEENS